MSYVPRVMQAFSRLLSYPDQHTSQATELLYVIFQGEIPAAANDIAQFGVFLEQHETWQIEETFTGTFDVNPACALEVGWHLFGEEYARGMFLVRMREELRKYDLPESAELPDHISHVLAVIAAMPDDAAAKFVRACVQPAVGKMNEALIKKDTPYKHVISCLATVMRQQWGTPKSSGQRDVLQTKDHQSDPLHAFPVADVRCGPGCGDSCGTPNVVSLDTDMPVANRPKSVATPEDRP